MYDLKEAILGKKDEFQIPQSPTFSLNRDNYLPTSEIPISKELNIKYTMPTLPTTPFNIPATKVPETNVGAMFDFELRMAFFNYNMRRGESNREGYGSSYYAREKRIYEEIAKKLGVVPHRF
jgi:hypothetical protein